MVCKEFKNRSLDLDFYENALPVIYYDWDGINHYCREQDIGRNPPSQKKNLRY